VALAGLRVSAPAVQHHVLRATAPAMARNRARTDQNLKTYGLEPKWLEPKCLEPKWLEPKWLEL
jgi:hypothetical protein